MSDHRVIHGRLTNDPELREVGESSVTEFSVAINRKYKKKDGEEVEEVHFANCSCWGKRGEVIANHFEKGQEIVCSGYMKTDTWEKDGEKKYKDKMIIDSFDFCGKKSD
jgi:single-strand DNA-binding protein